MPEVFTNAKAILADTETVVYTVPAGAVAIIIGCQATQGHNDLLDFNLWWKDASDGNAVTYLANTIKLPPEVSYNPIGGKFVLQEGDSLCGTASTAGLLHLTASILEIS